MANIPTDQDCGHSRLYVDSFRGPEKIEPCLWCERDKLKSEIARLRDALVKSVALIQGWHNMGLGKNASTMWDIYWRNAPEIKPIREALTAPEKTP